MKFLIDKSTEIVKQKSASSLVLGQLITPLTSYTNWGGVFGIDNGAFTRFDSKDFERILTREIPNQKRCLFVTVPDIVGSARRTLEIWRRHEWFVNTKDGWIPALVAQDGMEDFDIVWEEIGVLFIGGRDPWKESKAAQDLVRTAIIMGVPVHVGRVNSPERFDLFDSLGCQTCDGSGVSMYDHMLGAIEQHMLKAPEPTLYDDQSPS